MIFVCPVFPGENGALAAFSRLYAFPRNPDSPPSDGFCIMDSGAYGLHQRGGQMDASYIRKLANFYHPRVNDSVFAIAPDEFLNPAVSQQRFSSWHKQHSIPVVPVIQFHRMRHLDLYEILRQSAFYLKFREAIPTRQGRPFVCISNPGLWAQDCSGMGYAVRKMRDQWGDLWLHNLGAGWQPADVRAWQRLGCFDSIDSISYYSDAQRNLRWSYMGVSADLETPWQILAVHNARMAALAAGQAVDR